MEHKLCSCACCRENAVAPQRAQANELFPGVRLFYLPEAAQAAAAGEGESVLRVYVCRRGRLLFRAASGEVQSIRAGELAAWKEGSFRAVLPEPEEGFAGFVLRAELRQLTEQPPGSLLGTDITGERLYDLYCAQEAMTCCKAEDGLNAILDFFYAQQEKTAMAWRRLGAQALLLWLGQRGSDVPDAPDDSSEQVRIVREVHAFLTQNLDTRVTIEELSRQYLMNPTTLKQVFKSVYGASLAAHMKEHRMGKAAQLLRETDESVAEIARAVGYESQSKFTAAFKEYFGVLPKEYRKNH